MTEFAPKSIDQYAAGRLSTAEIQKASNSLIARFRIAFMNDEECTKAMGKAWLHFQDRVHFVAGEDDYDVSFKPYQTFDYGEDHFAVIGEDLRIRKKQVTSPSESYEEELWIRSDNRKSKFGEPSPTIELKSPDWEAVWGTEKAIIKAEEFLSRIEAAHDAGIIRVIE